VIATLGQQQRREGRGPKRRVPPISSPRLHGHDRSMTHRARLASAYWKPARERGKDHAHHLLLASVPMTMLDSGCSRSPASIPWNLPSRRCSSTARPPHAPITRISAPHVSPSSFLRKNEPRVGPTGHLLLCDCCKQTSGGGSRLVVRRPAHSRNSRQDEWIDDTSTARSSSARRRRRPGAAVALVVSRRRTGRSPLGGTTVGAPHRAPVAYATARWHGISARDARPSKETGSRLRS